MLYGAHVSIGGGIAEAIPRARAIGCDAVQIFTQNARQWKPTQHDPDDLAAFGPRAAQAGVRPPSATRSTSSTWRPPTRRSTQVGRALTDTVQIAAAIGADVCFHVGSHLGQGLAAAMPRILRGLEPAFAELGDDRWLLLENSAGAGDTIGRDVAELAAVIDAAGHPRLGLCLDTCHIYVSGVDLREPAQWTAVAEIDALDRARPAARLHVNDAAAPLGSNRDRHANIGAGELGRQHRRVPLPPRPAGPAGDPRDGPGRRAAAPIAASCASCGSSTAPACGHASARLPRGARRGR